MQEISRKLDLFSEKPRDLLGAIRGQILGVPTVLEDAIVEALSQDFGLSPEKGLTLFQERIRRSKERYDSERSMRHQELKCKS
jgi:hypothetical protein